MDTSPFPLSPSPPPTPPPPPPLSTSSRAPKLLIVAYPYRKTFFPKFSLFPGTLGLSNRSPNSISQVSCYIRAWTRYPRHINPYPRPLSPQLFEVEHKRQTMAQKYAATARTGRDNQRKSMRICLLLQSRIRSETS